MTRDTYRVHDDRDTASDAEIYTALWAAAPFPRLPDDAPAEIKKLTIDIDDPKRVYAIHRAARRHQFQILVERYILQLRYGCQSKTCNTSTCFSCRKRLAGRAPVRRFNATSARTLAIHLASQDNPENGLCHHASATRPVSESSKSPKPKSVAVDVKTISKLQTRSRINKSDSTSESEKVPPQCTNGDDKKLGRNGKQGRRKSSIEDAISKKAGPDLTALEEPTRTDHRSFVQNVYETFAFKMLEWLTPRNLDILAKSEDERAREDKVEENVPKVDSNDVEFTSEEADKAWSDALKALDQNINEVPEKDTSSVETSTEAVPKATPLEPKSVPSAQSKSPDKWPKTSHARRPESLRKKPDDIEPVSKALVNKKLSEHAEVARPLNSHSNSIPKRKLSGKSLITSPKMMTESPPTLHELQILPNNRTPELDSPSSKDGESERSSAVKERPNRPPVVPKSASTTISQPERPASLPQSLSHLTIDIIEVLCNLLQLDGTSEKHFLHPEVVDEVLKRGHDTSRPLYRSESLLTESIGYPAYAKQQWRSFIEQSFFDVLGRPESLLRSFSDEENRLFDTQTIWYLMLRLTRVAPSLVFDTLWNISGLLFRPPQKLEAAYEWAQSEDLVPQKALSNHDAAQVINICLHALVAAAPLVSDARPLANMSRIRSYGLAMEASSLEPAALCLQYEDAFTNDLALRLARRLFAAIPTRRRFAELLDLQKDIRNDEQQLPDVLETVLGTLRFLDLGTPPVLYFHDSERDLHEKRVPTLILDWARTVILQDWEGAAEVPSDGPLGGALATMAAIYKNRKSLLLGDIHFRTEYFAERLDQVEMPVEWLSFNQNKRTVHLLDYPYLFNPSTLVTYFRAINYSRMNQSYESAMATNRLIYHTISENTGSLMPEKYRRDRLYERLRTAISKFIVLDIRRDHVLVDTFNSIWRREERELMRPLKIRLGEEGGEEGLDSGGVQQEFFRLAIAEALDADYGTFTIDTRTKMTWFQPGSPEPLWKFELIGMIVSLAVYNGLTLPVTFPKALYRKLLDADVTELHHIADGWPDLANGLTSLLEWDEKDGLVEDIFARTYEFSVEQFGQLVSRQMDSESQWPQFSEMLNSSNPADAPSVTNENRNSYVSDYIRWLTDVSIRPQFDAFKKGFFACIDRRSISLFDPETLQSIVEGIQEIDIPEMRRATRYIGWDGDASHRTIRDFWSIVKRYDLEQKRKLLEFVTASDRVPVGGMRNLQFTLQRNGVDDGHLPTSYTCYGILLLPEYSSKDVLREKLAMALENSKGFGFA